MKLPSNGWSWARIVSTGALLAIAMTQSGIASATQMGKAATTQLPSDPADTRFAKQEAEAMQVIREWAAAWKSGDPAKVASYMTEDVQFRLDSSQPLLQGRDRLIKIVGSFIAAVKSLDMTRLSAVGGETDTLVLSERMDRFVGYDPVVQVAGVFRVKNGKIEEWYDIPLAKDRPPPPEGATINVD